MNMTNKQVKRKKLLQKVFGLTMIAISAALICMAASGVSPEDKDCTAVFLTFPLGVYLLFSKQIVIT